MGSVEDPRQSGRYFFVVLLQSKEGKALRWQQRGGPDSQTWVAFKLARELCRQCVDKAWC